MHTTRQRPATLQEARKRIGYTRSVLSDGLKLCGRWEMHPADGAYCQRFLSDYKRCITFVVDEIYIQGRIVHASVSGTVRII